ncbi:MAG: hypothetical protein WCS71_07365 [Sphaerochaetaceae bacterium]
MTTVAETMNPVLHLPFGTGYDIPSPSARVGLRIEIVMSVVSKSQESGEQPDFVELGKKLGIDDPDSYRVEKDLFGDQYESMLDGLSAWQMSIATQAMFIWLMPGGTIELAREFLADPTKPREGREPADHKPKAVPATRKKKAATTTRKPKAVSATRKPRTRAATSK